jgi:hypothetical protein
MVQSDTTVAEVSLHYFYSCTDRSLTPHILSICQTFYGLLIETD